MVRHHRAALVLVLLATSGPATATAHAGSLPLGADGSAAEATGDLFASVATDDPGCTVAVARDGEIVFAKAYGAARLDPLEPMTTETVVDIGSTSKQFTATSILLLTERGDVDLDAALATYVPGLPRWATQPTLRQMMHHESGIPDYISLLVERGFELTGSSTAEDALEALGEVSELDFEPGTAWEYSNSNYFLLAEVVQAVTGDDLGMFLGAEVFEPLGLDMVMDPIATIDAKAVSYQLVNEEWEVADSRWEQFGDGAVQTTPTELVTWAAEYWEPTIGGPDINTERLEGAAEVETNVTYGAGIIATELPGLGRVLTHSGGWGGFLTLFAVAPELRLATAATCTSPDVVAALPMEGETDLLALWSADK